MPLSPNMNLIVPTTGQTAGPEYANDLNASLALIDQHDHTAGNGVQIPTAGININTDLPFGGNSAIGLAASVYEAQTSFASMQATYVKGVDLYYRDGNNNEIQLTSGGSPAGGGGSITGLPSGTAGVNYSGGVYTFSAATNVGANIVGASFVLTNSTPLSKQLTLAPPNAMAANYTLTLPTAPSALSLVTLSNTGAFGTQLTITGSQIAAATITGSNIASATITGGNIAAATILTGNIAAATILGSNIANATVAKANMVAVGQAISASSGAFTTTSTSLTNVTNMSVTITTTGRPVMIIIQPASGANGFFAVRRVSGTGNSTGLIGVTRDASLIAEAELFNGASVAAVATTLVIPGSFHFFDPSPSAASHTYNFQAATVANSEIDITNCVIVAYEL